MQADELEMMKEAVLTAYAEVQERIKGLKDFTKPISPDASIGRLSRMDAMVNKSVDEFALRNAEVRLDGLKFWMDKMESLDFGLCVKCKEPIALKRFLYIPHSVRCIKCS